MVSAGTGGLGVLSGSPVFYFVFVWVFVLCVCWVVLGWFLVCCVSCLVVLVGFV